MIIRLHHIGIASKNIEKDQKFFELFSYKNKGQLREDKKTDISVQFMSGDLLPDIELVSNLTSGEGPVTPYLQSRRKIFHLAFETDDINADLREFVDNNNAVLLAPITYVKDNNTDIKAWCYLMFRNAMIVEVVEIKKV